MPLFTCNHQQGAVEPAASKARFQQCFKAKVKCDSSVAELTQYCTSIERAAGIGKYVYFGANTTVPGSTTSVDWCTKLFDYRNQGALASDGIISCCSSDLCNTVDE